MILTLRSAAPALAALAVAPPAVVAAAPASSEPPVVVATTSIWADIVDAVDCGDGFDVRTLIPVGGDAHAYEPSMRDAETLADAAVVIANGGGLEEQLHDTLEAVAGRGAVVVELFDRVAPADGGERGDEGDEDGHAHDGVDPHIWFDPTLVARAAPVIGDALVDAGGDADRIEACVASVVAELDELDAELAAIADDIPAEQRVLVTNHDNLGYFADRYGFEILGSVLPSSSTLSEASTSELDELAATIEATGTPAIFAESLEASDEAGALGERLGVDVVTLYTDSLGPEGSGAETYADLMRFDANAIADALR